MLLARRLAPASHSVQFQRMETTLRPGEGGPGQGHTPGSP
jgi:hypothetical protein